MKISSCPVEFKPAFDARVIQALSDIPSNPDIAIYALKLVKEYLESGDELPTELREWLLTALEEACSETEAKECAKKLARALGLRKGSRKQAGNWYALGVSVEQEIIGGKKKSLAILDVAIEHDISESAVSRAHKKWSEYKKLHDSAI